MFPDWGQAWKTRSSIVATVNIFTFTYEFQRCDVITVININWQLVYNIIMRSTLIIEQYCNFPRMQVPPNSQHNTGRATDLFAWWKHDIRQDMHVDQATVVIGIFSDLYEKWKWYDISWCRIAHFCSARALPKESGSISIGQWCIQSLSWMITIVLLPL